MQMKFRRSLIAAAMLASVLVAAPAQAQKIERIVSPGGIVAWLVQDSTVPLVALQFAFRGGASQDPAAKSGVGHMVAGMLDEGAGEYDARAFQERMEREAIELSFNVDRDHFRGGLRTLSERRETAFDLLRLALTAPRFEESAIERTRTQTQAQLRRESTDPGSLATQAWWTTAYAGHPYGRPNKGTSDTVRDIKIEDLRGYKNRVLARDNLKVAIVGDIDAAAAGAMLDKVFGALPAKAELSVIPPAQPSGLGDKKTVSFDTPQSVVSFGGVGLPRKHPDYMTAHIVNHILGGGSFTSRLYSEVREKRGLAYGVSTHLLPMEFSALFMGWTQVRSEKTDESITVMQHEIRQMAEGGPSEDELAKAKDYVKGSYALGFDTSTKIASQLLGLQLQDLGIDYIATRDKIIDAVTLDDAKRVAKSLLEGGLLFTVVGKPTPAVRPSNPG